jgi:hypothetical protein
MGAARQDMFGTGDQPTEVLPGKFFDYDVASVDPAGGSTQRNPAYCATKYGAEAVAGVLGATSTVYGPAMTFGGQGGGFADSKPVPWLVFTKDGQSSIPVNAGQLLHYFNHASIPATQMEADKALKDAQFEVSGAF